MPGRLRTSIFMEKEWIAYVRCKFEIPEAVTDERFNELETYLGNLSHTFDPIRVGNWIALLAMREDCFPGFSQLGLFPGGFDTQWEGRCERMFLEAEYGPCCIWARATIDMRLQELCLASNKVPEEFKNKIRCPGWNPSIKDCLCQLGNSLSDDDRCACLLIRDNGGAVVHHRLDEILDGMSPGDILRGYGVAEDILKTVLFKLDERQVLMMGRLDKEREKAEESMRALYGFISRRAPQKMNGGV